MRGEDGSEGFKGQSGPIGDPGPAGIAGEKAQIIDINYPLLIIIEMRP